MGAGFAAGGHDPLGFVEAGLVDQGWVGAGHSQVAVVDLAEVGAVGEDAGDGVAGPGPAGAVGHAPWLRAAAMARVPARLAV